MEYRIWSCTCFNFNRMSDEVKKMYVHILCCPYMQNMPTANSHKTKLLVRLIQLQQKMFYLKKNYDSILKIV